MPSLLQRTLTLLVGDVNLPKFSTKTRPLQKYTERELLTLESQIGAQLFGPIEPGRRREFFCLDEKTWIWYEEWLDEKRKLKSSTTRYEIQDKAILKVQEGACYSFIEGDELTHLGIAIKMYYERVMRELYDRNPTTGESLRTN